MSGTMRVHNTAILLMSQFAKFDVNSDQYSVWPLLYFLEFAIQSLASKLLYSVTKFDKIR